MNELEEVKGKTVKAIEPIYSGNDIYMIKIEFTDGTVLEIDREHTEDHYLQHRIK